MYAWHFLPISFYFYCWLLFMSCLVCNEIIQTETLSIQMTNCKYAFISSNMLFDLNFETTKCPTVLAFIHQLHSIQETFFTIHLLDKHNGNQRNREYFQKKKWYIENFNLKWYQVLICILISGMWNNLRNSNARTV